MKELAKIATEEREQSLTKNLAVGGLAGVALGNGLGGVLGKHNAESVAKEKAHEYAKGETIDLLEGNIELNQSLFNSPEIAAQREEYIRESQETIEYLKRRYEKSLRNGDEWSIKQWGDRLAESEQDLDKYVNTPKKLEQQWRDGILNYKNEPRYQRLMKEQTPLFIKEELKRKRNIGSVAGLGLGLSGGGLAYLANRQD